jgi:hypothetical protein
MDDMAAVKESHLDRLYRQIQDILKRKPLPDEQLRELIDKAAELKCGFVVEQGKPGTLRISPFVPMNTIVKIDMDYILDDPKSYKLPGWEKFQ